MSKILGMDALNKAQTNNRPKQSWMPTNNLVSRSLVIFAVVLLLLIGLVMVYSASSIRVFIASDADSSTYYITRQLIFVALGLILCAVAARIPYQVWATNLVWIPWILVILALAYTAVNGFEVLGAKRWMTVPGLGRFQPSEFAKISVVLVLAKIIPDYQNDKYTLLQFLGLLLVAAGVPAAFVVAQPDLGSTVLILLGAVVALWFGELDARPIVAASVLVLVLGVMFTLLSEYRRERLFSLLHPEDPKSDLYQTLTSLYAFSSGGLFGVGLGNSYQKTYLPEQHTDFIFSVLGEEMGFVGAVAVILLFCMLTFGGIVIALKSRDTQGRIIASAIVCIIMVQALLNMACSLGLFPVTGKPLPFVSYGGSSMFTSMIMVGLILSVSFDWRESTKAQRRRNEMQVIEGGRSSRSGSDRSANGNSRKRRS